MRRSVTDYATAPGLRAIPLLGRHVRAQGFRRL